MTAANKAGILINDTVLEPLASAEACLTQDERDLGCCLLDIGGGTTELIVYGGGVVRHTGAVAIGGDHFTNDLAVGLRTPIPEAERIKRHHGCAAAAHLLRDDGSIEIASVGDRPPRTIFARMLDGDHRTARAGIARAGCATILRRAGLDSADPRGICPGGRRGAVERSAGFGRAQFPFAGAHCASRAESLDLPEQVAQPEYATVVGLVLYAAKARRAGPAKAREFGFQAAGDVCGGLTALRKSERDLDARAVFHRPENCLWKRVNTGFIKDFHQPDRGKA